MTGKNDITDSHPHAKLFASGFLHSFPWKEKLIEPAANKKVVIELADSADNLENIHGWNMPESYKGFIYLTISSRYFADFSAGKKDHFILLEVFNESIALFRPLIQKLYSSTGDTGIYLNIVLMIVELDDVVLLYKFDLLWEEKIQREAWESLKKLINRVQKKNVKTKAWLNSLHVQENNLRFLYYDSPSKSWQLLDRLLEITEHLGKNIVNELNDSRVRKPYVVFNEADYNQHFTLGDQWSLKLESLPIIMRQPNDIALYVHLSEKNLAIAKQFFEGEVSYRNKHYYLPLLYPEETLKYYDYFEAVIAAVTFSYTSLETFANTFIPFKYEHIEEKDGIKTIYSKAAIERKLSLKDKLKIILTKVLSTPSPVDQKWWQRFIGLEQIRNEIIHAKQSKTQERYSQFLSNKNFELIEVNKEIITWYGSFISNNLRSHLIEYPFGFGHDAVSPAFMRKRDFINHQKERRGIPIDEIEDENEKEEP